MKHCLSFTSVFVLATIWISSSSRADESPRHPNIVLILADDLGYGDVACYNPASKIATPNMDGLAADGVRFTDAYSPAAVCVPSRYSLLTGRYPLRGEPLRWTSHPTIADGQMTLGSLLQSAGYTTACVGKWHCGFDGGVASQDRPLTGGPLDRGFDYFFGQHGSLDQPPYFYIRNRHAVQPATEDVADSQEDGLSVVYQGKFWRAGKIAPDFKHEEALDRYVDESLTFLHNQSGQKNGPEKPFFLYLALTAPHGPWLPSQQFLGKSEAGPLGDFVMHVDHAVGRVLRTLDELGCREDTLVILTSDNGPLWFEPDVERYGHNSSGPFRGRKGDIWEGGIRMPLIARWPGKIPAGSTSEQVCGLFDLMGTFAAIVGQPLPDGAGVDSCNMLPAMIGRDADGSIRDSIVLQSLGAADLAIRQGPWKFIPWIGSGGFLTKPRRVEPSAGEPAGQLYHLGNDPEERHNLHDVHPDVVARLSKLLAEQRVSDRTRPDDHESK